MSWTGTACGPSGTVVPIGGDVFMSSEVARWTGGFPSIGAPSPSRRRGWRDGASGGEDEGDNESGIEGGEDAGGAVEGEGSSTIREWRCGPPPLRVESAEAGLLSDGINGFIASSAGVVG